MHSGREEEHNGAQWLIQFAIGPTSCVQPVAPARAHIRIPARRTGSRPGNPFRAPTCSNFERLRGMRRDHPQTRTKQPEKVKQCPQLESCRPIAGCRARPARNMYLETNVCRKIHRYKFNLPAQAMHDMASHAIVEWRIAFKGRPSRLGRLEGQTRTADQGHRYDWLSRESRLVEPLVCRPDEAGCVAAELVSTEATPMPPIVAAACRRPNLRTVMS